MKNKVAKKYKIFVQEFKYERDGEVICDLYAEGNTLEELLSDAEYGRVDWHGNELDFNPADDAKAVDYIEEWFAHNVG